MFKKFLNGVISVIPFFYKRNVEIKFFPEDIYVNDWKIIGNIMSGIIRKKQQ